MSKIPKILDIIHFWYSSALIDGYFNYPFIVKVSAVSLYLYIFLIFFQFNALMLTHQNVATIWNVWALFVFAIQQHTSKLMIMITLRDVVSQNWKLPKLKAYITTSLMSIVRSSVWWPNPLMTWWRTRSIKNMPFGQKWGDFEKIINWNYYFENLILTTKYSGRDQNGDLILILTFNLVIRLISSTVWSPRSIRTLIRSPEH